MKRTISNQKYTHKRGNRVSEKFLKNTKPGMIVLDTILSAITGI